MNRIRYAIESIREPGAYLSSVTFSSPEEADKYIWQHDSLFVMDAKIEILVDGKRF